MERRRLTDEVNKQQVPLFGSSQKPTKSNPTQPAPPPAGDPKKDADKAQQQSKPDSNNQVPPQAGAANPAPENANPAPNAVQYRVCATQASVSGLTSSAGQLTYSYLVPDVHYLQLPRCVLCLAPRAGRRRGKGGLIINPNLAGGWLHWHALPGAARPDNAGPDDISLGVYGNYELFVARDQAKKLAEFSIFILAASEESDATSTAAGAAAAGGGGAGNQSSAKPIAPPLYPVPIFNAGGGAVP